MQNTEKNKMIIFIAIAYGLTFLMAFPMYLGFRNGYDLSMFPVAQMLYPACGVIIGQMYSSRKTKNRIPYPAFILTLVLTGIMILFSLASVFFHLNPITLSGMTMDIFYLIGQFVIIPFSLAIFILLCVCSKESKENAGIVRKNMKKGILIVLLFILIYFARIFLAFGIDELLNHNGTEEMKDWLKTMCKFETAIGLVNVIINYVLTFILFFGEEYGWRYFLQPRMQQKFGLRCGVILLGIAWGLWHTPLDFMYYTTTCGPQMLVNQIITCIAYSIFFGYAYMKTQNIWIPVMLHYLNNNLVPVIEADYLSEVFQNTEIAWSDIPVAAILMIFYVLFIFAKEYRSSDKK